MNSRLSDSGLQKATEVQPGGTVYSPQLRNWRLAVCGTKRCLNVTSALSCLKSTPGRTPSGAAGPAPLECFSPMVHHWSGTWTTGKAGAVGLPPPED